VRLLRSQGYPLLLAGLFVLAAVRRSDLPGEDVLPELYRRAIFQPILAQVAPEPGGDEAARLRDELAAARHELREAREELAKSSALDAHLRGLEEWDGRTRRLRARVLFREPERDGIRAFRIDRGERDGVRLGMAVVDGVAMVGAVSKVEPAQSIVQRVDDGNFRLEVEIEAKGGAVAGIAYGDTGGFLDVRFLRRADGVEPGAAVFTTAYRREVPRGLLVGRVDRVRDADRDDVFEASVEAAAALRPLARVEVIWSE